MADADAEAPFKADGTVPLTRWDFRNHMHILANLICCIVNTLARQVSCPYFAGAMGMSGNAFDDLALH